MWGLLFRITGRRLETGVPGFLSSAAGTGQLVAYLERCATELARDPARYGFDPASSYTLLAQSWDRALSPARSVAWGRDRLGHPAVRLIPDFYFTSGEGFAHLRRDARACPPWSRRDPTLVWRGALNASGVFASPGDVPRVQLALRAGALAGTDVKLTGVGETMAHSHPGPAMSDFLLAHGLQGEFWPMSRFGDFRFVVDIDGYGNAWGLLEKLILGCCVLKVDSPYEQWFYPRLHRGEHYVPVRADLSDLQEKIAWCRDNEAECEWIAANGARLAASMTFEAELARSCEEIMIAARATRA